MIVDGYTPIARPVSFSTDGRWLLTSWADFRLRLWPLGERMPEGHRVLELPEGTLWEDAIFATHGRFVFVVGNVGRTYVVPLDGSPPRRLAGFSDDTLLTSAAVSPSGQQVAAAFSYGQGLPTLRVWDLTSGAVRVFELPEGSRDSTTQGSASSARTGFERGVRYLYFVDETTLYTAGDGGIRRWELGSGTHRLVFAVPRGHRARMLSDQRRRSALIRDVDLDDLVRCRSASVLDLATGASRPLPQFGECAYQGLALDPSGVVVATGDRDGIVRVGRVSGGEPHLLVGHEGPVDFVAISPDLKWVASTGEDNTLRVWPMPDLDKPPLHTLPHDELIAKLKLLTNLRAVRDPAAPNGWKIEIGPFPGWEDVPTW